MKQRSTRAAGVARFHEFCPTQSPEIPPELLRFSLWRPWLWLSKFVPNACRCWCDSRQRCRTRQSHLMQAGNECASTRDIPHGLDVCGSIGGAAPPVQQKGRSPREIGFANATHCDWINEGSLRCTLDGERARRCRGTQRIVSYPRKEGAANGYAVTRSWRFVDLGQLVSCAGNATATLK